MNNAIGEPRYNANVRFEKRDIRLTSILVVLILLFCWFAVQIVVIAGAFRFALHIEAISKRSPYSQAEKISEEPPREPRLEPIDRMRNDPQGNLAALDEQMEQRLHGSGPADEKGFVHIPIEAAMKEMVSKLPVGKTTPASGGSSRGTSP